MIESIHLYFQVWASFDPYLTTCRFCWQSPAALGISWNFPPVMPRLLPVDHVVNSQRNKVAQWHSDFISMPQSKSSFSQPAFE